MVTIEAGRSAVPAPLPTVTVTLTLHAALIMAAMAGRMTDSSPDGGLHDALCEHDLYQYYKEARDVWEDSLSDDSTADLQFDWLAQLHDGTPLSAIKFTRCKPCPSGRFTVGKVYTVDMSKTTALWAEVRRGVIRDDAGIERVFFMEEFCVRS